MKKVAVLGNPSAGISALTHIAKSGKETIIIDNSMQKEKEQAARDLDKKLAAEHAADQTEFEKEQQRMEREDRRKNINNLVGIKYDTERPGTYQEFKQAMEKLYECEFERSYLRKLYRKYQANFKAAN